MSTGELIARFEQDLVEHPGDFTVGYKWASTTRQDLPKEMQKGTWWGYVAQETLDSFYKEPPELFQKRLDDPVKGISNDLTNVIEAHLNLRDCSKDNLQKFSRLIWYAEGHSTRDAEDLQRDYLDGMYNMWMQPFEQVVKPNYQAKIFTTSFARYLAAGAIVYSGGLIGMANDFPQLVLIGGAAAYLVVKSAAPAREKIMRETGQLELLMKEASLRLKHNYQSQPEDVWKEAAKITSKSIKPKLERVGFA
jgi:hypothetical protein